MAPKPRFTKGEKVLCKYGTFLYEAKCLKQDLSGVKRMYLIHYCGWNKKWDEWVFESRVLKLNRTNLKKQKDLEKTHLKSKSVAKARVKKEPLQTTASNKRVKPKIDKKASDILGFPVTQDYLIQVVETCCSFIGHMAEVLASSHNDSINI